MVYFSYDQGGTTIRDHDRLDSKTRNRGAKIVRVDKDTLSQMETRSQELYSVKIYD